MKAISWKYTDLRKRQVFLGRPVNLDYLTGNIPAITTVDYSTMPAYNYLLMVNIQRKWRSSTKYSELFFEGVPINKKQCKKRI